MSATPPPSPAVVPSTLFTQIFALVLATVVVAQLLSLALIALLPAGTPRAVPVAQLAAAVRAPAGSAFDYSHVAAAPAQTPTLAAQRLRGDIAKALGRPPADVRLQLAASEAQRHVEIAVAGRFQPALAGHFQLGVREGAGWLVLEPQRSPFASRDLRFLLLFWATAFAMLPIAWLFARRLARPFEQFADAAERVGRDPLAAAPTTRGPLEVVRAVDAMGRMQQRLRAYVAERTQMLGAIAHDLRTPLMRLAFRAEALPEAARPPIAADIAEMEAIMQATLDFASAASPATARQPLELSSLLGQLCSDLAATGQPVHLRPAEPAIVAGDPVQLRRLFANLIANAIAYGGSATVSLRQSADGVEVDVEDAGPGIAQAELEQVFEPFYRLESSRSRATGGTGLGLAVVRAIARAHGGEVQLRNRAGGGLCARLTLPAADGAFEPAATLR